MIGSANKGDAGVPGVLRLTVFSDDGKVNVSGCVDPVTRSRQAFAKPCSCCRLEQTGRASS